VKVLCSARVQGEQCREGCSKTSFSSLVSVALWWWWGIVSVILIVGGGDGCMMVGLVSKAFSSATSEKQGLMFVNNFTLKEMHE